MIEEEVGKLLEKTWLDEERDLIKRIMDSMLYYKRIIPKSLKKDIVDALQMCNRLKEKIDEMETKLLS